MRVVLWLSLLITPNIYSIDSKNVWNSLYELFFGTTTDQSKTAKINYYILEESVGMFFDVILGAADQSEEIQAELIEYKKNKIPIIMKRLQSMRFKNYYEAVDEMRVLTFSAIAQHIGEQAVRYAQEKIPHSPLLQEIKQEFIARANEEKKETRCGLCHLYGAKLKEQVFETINKKSNIS